MSEQYHSDDSDLFAYVGCYTTPQRKARGRGISVFRVDRHTGSWKFIQLVPLLNPSFLAADKSGNFLCSIHGDSSEINSFSIDRETGCLSSISEQTTQGKNPVHLTFNRTNEFLVVPNYTTSSLVALPFDQKTGEIGPLCSFVAIEGEPGPHRVEQPYPRPHQVEFDPSGRYVVVPDKGSDQVLVYELNEGGALLLRWSIPARRGSAPRHVAFHPTLPFVYVLNELDSTVTAYDFDSSSGHMKPFQILSSLPDTFVGNSTGAEIGIFRDGKFLVVSNRGADALSSFRISADDGRLTFIKSVASGGKTPRNFAGDLHQRFLYVANENSDTIDRFVIDSETGEITPSGEQIHVASPVSIVFVKALMS